MKISKLKVYELEESIIASGYPMITDLFDDNYQEENFRYWLDNNLVEIYNIIKTNNLKVVNDYVVLNIDNKEVLISGEDLIRINNYSWSYNHARGYIRSTKGDIELHRFVMNNPQGKCVDHINRDKLDNRRDNLRLCTHRENTINRDVSASNSSGIIGVYWSKDKQKWYSKIECNKKRIHLGYSKDKEEAIIKRLQAENEYFGEFAPQRHLFEKYNIVNVTKSKNTQKPSLEKAIRALKRFYSLGRTGGNEGHNQFMTGVRVAFDLTFSNKAWVEAERYRFLEFVSSQSTMHRITKLDIRKCCNKYVWESTIKNLEEAVAKYNAIENKGSEEAKELYLEILYNVPSGFELTARLTTNYRALKTIYNQRKNHRLPEWREFCEYMKNNLPLFKEIVLGE